MSDKPPISLSYHTPERRPRFLVNRRGVLTLLLILCLCAAIGGWQEVRAKRAREAERAASAMLKAIQNQRARLVRNAAAPPSSR